MRRLDCPGKKEEVTRAEYEDIPELIQVCRRSFPDSIKWQGAPVGARRWWKNVMSASAAEIYILQSEGQIAAFSLLITDENLSKTQVSSRPIPLWLTLLTMVTCPIVALRKARKALSDHFRASESVATAAVPVYWKPETRVWIGLIAVDPSHRGKGFAKQLLKYCDERTAAIGKRVIGLKVDSDNRSAQRLYQCSGYVRIASNSDSQYYAKNLDLNISQSSSRL